MALRDFLLEIIKFKEGDEIRMEEKIITIKKILPDNKYIVDIDGKVGKLSAISKDQIVIMIGPPKPKKWKAFI